MMHSTAIKLRIKRPAAVFLSFLLIAAITVCTVGAATLINGTVAENLASPKYYSALKDWNSSANSPESDNIFYYQFTMDKENLNWDYMTNKEWGYWYTGSTDYTNFTNLTAEQWAEKYNSNTFKRCCGISPKGFMRLWNENACLSFIDTVPAVALAFRAKDDGYVDILAHSVDIAYNSNYFTKEQDYKALVRMTNNGENVYPESGWLEVSDNATSVSIPELEIKVSSGDMIRLEVTASQSPTNTTGHGVDVVQYYCMSDRTGYYTGFNNTNEEWNFGLFYEADYFDVIKPKPAGIAYANMTRQLESYVHNSGKIDSYDEGNLEDGAYSYNVAGVRAFRFDTELYGEVVVAYSNSEVLSNGKKNILHESNLRTPNLTWNTHWQKTDDTEFTAKGQTVKVVDIMGNTTVYTPDSNGKVSIPLTGSPVYIYGIQFATEINLCKNKNPDTKIGKNT